MISRRVILTCLLAVVVLGPTLAADVTFTPLDMPQGNIENRTGMWLCPDLGKKDEVLPLKSRVWATQESVTGGVAAKCVFEKGSKGVLTYEKDGYPAGSAGLTLYAKASRKLTLKVAGAPIEVGTEWKKFDLPWERLGTNRDQPRVGYQLVFAVQGPIEEKTWLILDRVGTESPQFEPSPRLEPKTGPDAVISSKDILYGAEHLAKTRERAKSKQPFKVIALGDSVTAGAQMSRGTPNVRGPDGVPFLYFSHLARLAEQHFGYQGITPVQHGHGGWTAAQALKVIDKEVVDEAGPNDLVILEFGANDLSWAKTPLADWKANMKKLIARAKTRTDQIIIMSPTPIGGIGKLQPEITKALQELVQEEKVAAADITKLAYYRGEPFAWAWLANEGHPAYMGHITMAEMMAALLTEQHRNYPE
ncbi:MAG: SGNH/GDSL hydrolase family protein [Planctomycetia bacterium]|nr:SGNH/GDSL hydrolase family protein [Planctomycetia bacterium]